jgi:FkbM family methyltransferase
MLHGVKKLLKESVLVQAAYRQYVQPYLPQYEPETYVLRGMKFDRCVDVGAHAGTYSILLSHNSDHVYAFEPSHHSFNILRSLSLENVTAYNLALGSEAGALELFLPTVGGEVDYALARLRSIMATDDQPGETQRVEVARFNDFETEIDFRRLDFVKIDVEGFEMRVLRGMDRLVELRKCALLIEIEQRHNPNYPEVFEFLRQLGYEPYFTADGVWLRRLDIAELPSLQSAERLASDGARKFRLGERKNYINNIFFLQPWHKAQYQIAA